MKRPAGVTFTAVVLGLIAALQLVFAVLLVVLERVLGIGIMAPSNQNPDRSTSLFLLIGVVVVAIFCVLVAAWCIATLVGLLRLRNWARYSVMVLGGCMAVLAFFSIAGIVLAATVNQVPASAIGQAPATHPHTMQFVFAVYAFLYVLVAAVGIWWLIYFNLRRTKAYFLPNYAVELEQARNPYLSAAARFSPSAPSPAPAGRLAGVPAPIIVIAILLLLASLCCMIYAFLPFPVFLLGMLINGRAVAPIYLAMAALTGMAGVGLLRLDNRARLATLAFLVVGVVIW